MKKYLLLFFLLSKTIMFSQSPEWEYYQINFEDSILLQRLTIDTIRNVNNTWQVGTPQKLYFSDVCSEPNVIVTDTINSYPSNDTSAFYITHSAYNGSVHGEVGFQGCYKVNCDTLRDYGKIEISLDKGQNWFDPLSDTMPEFSVESSNPVFTGISDWTFFNITIHGDILKDIELGDTILYKFMFISDDIDNKREGLMFDDLFFYDQFESVKSFSSNNFKSIVYPNPGYDQIEISFENTQRHTHSLIIFDATGRMIHRNFNFSSDKISIEVSIFGKGVYIYYLTDTSNRETSIGKFLIE